ncbi:hypothetical protein RND81_03G121900 [Saponaria officinalis]|uniref:Poly [ADP-ribose] polymerase n=1 Tax=Saponaria officinalis TaxID=3572 RepID=A0AAW1M8A3_SAPOF
MESNFAKVSDSGRKVFVNQKKNKAPRFATYLSGASRNVMSRNSTLYSNSPSLKLGKRKKPDACKSMCKSCKPASQRALSRYYMNFMKTGLPKRLMFYKNGKWVDHDAEVIDVVRKEFELKKSVVEMKLNGHHLIFDFVRMVQFNFGTALELPMAWIDEDGGCFFPEIYTNFGEQNVCSHNEKQIEEFSSLTPQHGVQEIKLQIEIDVSGTSDTKAMEYCGESSHIVKRIKVDRRAEVEDSCDNMSDVRVKEDVEENQPLKLTMDELEKKLDVETVRVMFTEGMKMDGSVNVIGLDSNSGSMWQDRLELFLKQVEITNKIRGNANVCYAWLASTKEASSGIMAHGLGHFGLQQIKSAYGTGVHLATANCAETSANYCDVDENGVQYMVLCRVIMGNMEMIHAGSKQFHPSSENFDSGVDDPQNPRHYVVWSMNINTHIYPEYVVSFKVTSNSEGSAIKNGKPVQENCLFPLKVGPGIDMGNEHRSNVTSDGSRSKERTASLNSTNMRVPKSPWMPFPLLLAAISKQVPPGDMKVVLTHYEQFKNKVINRESFVKNLRLIVGDAILKTTITELNRKVMFLFQLPVCMWNLITCH